MAGGCVGSTSGGGAARTLQVSLLAPRLELNTPTEFWHMADCLCACLARAATDLSKDTRRLAVAWKSSATALVALTQPGNLTADRVGAGRRSAGARTGSQESNAKA